MPIALFASALLTDSLPFSADMVLPFCLSKPMPSKNASPFETKTSWLKCD
jgi:hypothetical protein